jgi:phage tail-like protein
MTDRPKDAMADTRQSNLLQYLPAIYREEPFVGQFLLAFEKLLLGRDDKVPITDAPPLLPIGEADAPEAARRDRSADRNLPDAPPALERTATGIATYFDPHQTPKDFLPWLASWTAFSLRADLEPAKQRDFIANIVSLYRARGTKKNLEQFLSIFTIGRPTVSEVASDGSNPPHFFWVTVAIPDRLKTDVHQRQFAIVRALIELEKPAHTDFELDWVFPSMQVGKVSTVGVDTLLGTADQARGGRA